MCCAARRPHQDRSDGGSAAAARARTWGTACGTNTCHHQGATAADQKPLGQAQVTHCADAAGRPHQEGSGGGSAAAAHTQLEAITACPSMARSLCLAEADVMHPADAAERSHQDRRGGGSEAAAHTQTAATTIGLELSNAKILSMTQAHVMRCADAARRPHQDGSGGGSAAAAGARHGRPGRSGRPDTLPPAAACAHAHPPGMHLPCWDLPCCTKNSVAIFHVAEPADPVQPGPCSCLCSRPSPRHACMLRSYLVAATWQLSGCIALHIACMWSGCHFACR